MAVTFIVAYASTETQSASNNHIFWTPLDRVVGGGAKTRTVARADGCHRPHEEEGEGRGWKQE